MRHGSRFGSTTRRSRADPGCSGRSARPMPGSTAACTSTGPDRPLVTDGLFRVHFAADRSRRAAAARRLATDRESPASKPDGPADRRSSPACWLREKLPAGARPRRSGAAGGGTEASGDQAHSRDPSAARPVGGERPEARRGELDRARPARSGRGAGSISRNQGRTVCEAGRAFPRARRPQPGAAQPVAAARALVRRRPQGPARRYVLKRAAAAGRGLPTGRFPRGATPTRRASSRWKARCGWRRCWWPPPARS